jgi:hypothetical protein
MPDTFIGVTNFFHNQDTLQKTFPGFRYENCANGGHYKGLAIQRRMTFVTTNDNGGLSHRQTHWVNSHAMSPLQLNADTGPTGGGNATFMLRGVMMGAWMTSTDLGGIGPNPCGPTGEKPCVLHSATFKLRLTPYTEKQWPISRGGDVYHIFSKPDGTNHEGMQFFNCGLNKASACTCPSPPPKHGAAIRSRSC